MGFTRRTIAGKTLEQFKESAFEPVQKNLYDLLKKEYWPSFFVRHETNIAIASSALIGLCVGAKYVSTQSLSTQLGLTIGTFFGSIAGYNLIKAGWNYFTNLVANT